MKKAFVVFSLCLVLALGGLTAAVVTLHDSRDDVEVSLTTRSGDPVQAQGLTIAQQARFSANLLWDLTIPAEDPAMAETAFGFHPLGTEWTVHEETPLSLYTSESSTHYIEGTHTVPTAELLAGDPALSQMVPLLEEIAAQTEPGKSFSKIIHPGDYLDAVPYQVYASLPHTVLRFDENTLDHYDKESVIPRFFQKAFPLTFSEEELWTVTVKKRTTGYLEEVGYSSNGPTAQVDLLTDYNDQALYLALSQNTWPQPDYATFPLGNGVYRMNITHEKEESFVEVKTLTNIFPIPDEAVVLDLTLDGEDTLLVTWYDAGDYRCTILDTETLEPRETFSLFQQERSEAEVIVHDNYSGQEYSYDTWSYVELRAIPGENFILFLGVDRFWLFLPSQGGWQQQCTASLGEAMWYTSGEQVTAAWNGEKIAIGDADPWMTGLILWVYDGAGELLFNGKYETSLSGHPDKEDFTSNSNVLLMEEKEVTLRWET